MGRVIPKALRRGGRGGGCEEEGEAGTKPPAAACSTGKGPAGSWGGGGGAGGAEKARSPAPHCGVTHGFHRTVWGNLLQLQQELAQTASSDLREGGEASGGPRPPAQPSRAEAPATPPEGSFAGGGRRVGAPCPQQAPSRVRAGAERGPTLWAVSGCGVTPSHLTPVQTPKTERQAPKGSQTLLWALSSPPARPGPREPGRLRVWAPPARL